MNARAGVSGRSRVGSLRIRKFVVMVTTAATLCAFGITIPNDVSGAATPVTADGSITCVEVTGTVSFSPSLSSRSTTTTLTAKVSLSGCKQSNTTNVPSAKVVGTISSRVSLSSVHCNSLASIFRSSFGTIAWSGTTPITSLSATYLTPTGSTSVLSGVHHVGLSLTGLSGTGSYTANNGTASSVKLFTSFAPAHLLSSCQSKKGISSLVISSGIVTVAGKGPTYTSPTTATFIEGTHGSFTVSVVNVAMTTFGWSGTIPTGLTLVNNGDGSTATLSGIPAVGSHGTYPINITAVDTTGAYADQVLTVYVRPIAPNVPIVTQVSPSVNTSSTVTISGKNFAGATSVLFGSTPSTLFTPNGAGTSMTASVPVSAAGTFDVTVTTPDGTSPISISDQFTYHVPPQPPVIVSVQPEGLGILVSWAPNPTTDHVTSYGITAVVVPAFATSAGPSCQPTGATTTPGTSTGMLVTTNICAGVPYTVTITATNAWGTSAASTPSNTVVPMVAQPPSAPLITSVLARSASLIVNWAPPALLGGDPLTGYTLSASLNNAVVVTTSPSASTSQTTLSGLTDGVTYDLSLTAQSVAGSSPAATAQGTPSSDDKPGPPASLDVMSNGSNGIVVNWSPPVDTGSAPLTGYAVSYWATLPLPTCKALASSSLSSTWSPPSPLKVTSIPACARGFTSVVIDGHQVAASSSAGVSGLVLTSGGDFAINVGATVFFNVPTSINVSATTTTYTLTGLPPANYYEVAVSAVSSVGTGPATQSSEPVTATVGAAPGAEILSANTMDLLKSQAVDSAGNGRVYTWSAKATFSPALHAGSVLIGSATSTAVGGILAVVQSVSTTPAGDIAVDTTPASASQAFSTLTFSSSGVPPAASNQSMSPLISGVRNPSAASAHAATGDPVIPIDWSWGALAINGQVAFTPSVSFGAALNCQHRFLGICYSFQASVESGASLSASANLTASISGDTTIPLDTITFGCICFTVGPLPVVILPELNTSLTLSGSGIAVTASATMALGGAVTWDSSNGFSSNHSTSVAATGGPTIEATANGTATLQLEFQLCLYAVLCGNIQANGNLQVNAAFNGPAYFSICPSLTINAGLSIDVIFWSTSHEWQIATFAPSPACYTLNSPPITLSVSPASATVGLGPNAQTFTSSRSDLGTPTDSWTLLNPISPTLFAPGDSISSTGVLSTCCTGGNRLLVLSDTDSTDPTPIAPAYASIIVGNVLTYDPPGNLSAVGGPASGSGSLSIPTEMTVSWNAPILSAGSAIQYYIVTINGVTLFTTNTSIVDPIPLGGAWYDVQVIAVNLDGLSSPQVEINVNIP